jgi:hypothetical protein
MASVGSLLNSGYYSLSDLSSGASGSGVTSANTTLSLAAVLASQDAAQNSTGSAYLLNLSPAAQQLLNNSSTFSGAPSSGNFTLSTAQQAQITSIIAKYKDAPYTQATFDQIQSDLQAAGLGTQDLAVKDQVTSFDPTGVLLNALSGNTTDLTTQNNTSSANEQTKAGNYIQSILGQWQSVSTTYTPSSSSAA